MISGKPNRMRVNLKGLHKVKRLLSDGSIRVHYYAWRGGPALSGDLGSPEFHRSYNDAITKRKTPEQGNIFTLISEFKASAEFQTKLSAESRRAYLRYLKIIEEQFGSMPIAALYNPKVRGEFKRFRDGFQDNPRKSDYIWTTLARVLSYAKDGGRITVNPCERGGRLYSGGRADKIWTEGDLGKMFAVVPKEIRRIIMVAIWTGQREGDILRLGWSNYDGKHIRLKQSKGGRRVTIPVSSILKAELNEIKKAGTVMLLNTRGRPWTPGGFRASFRKLQARAGIKGLTFHDFRGTAVVRLAIAGCTVPEIAAITGHSLKDVEAILDKHYLGRDIQLAENAIRKLERTERKRKLSTAGKRV